MIGLSDVAYMEYRKYPKLTNQNVWVTDYQKFLLQKEYHMIPCGIKLSKDIPYVPVGLCFRYGIFELNDILSSEMLKDEYSLEELGAIEQKINDVNYEFIESKNSVYSLNDLALIKSSNDLYFVEKNNYVLASEPTEGFEESDFGYIYYKHVTSVNGKTVGESIHWYPETQEIMFSHIDDFLDDSPSSTFYLDDFVSFLPQELQKDQYTKDELITIEDYFNKYKEKLFVSPRKR